MIPFHLLSPVGLMLARTVSPIRGRLRKAGLGFSSSTFGLPFLVKGLAKPTIAPQRPDPQGAIRTVTLPLSSRQTPLALSPAKAAAERATPQSVAVANFPSSFNRYLLLRNAAPSPLFQA